ATPDDVAAGRAVFSLRDGPDAQVRVVAMKLTPAIARWKSLKQFPLREPRPREWPKANEKWDDMPKEEFDREGLIWQAEEVMIGGKWRRYYGFIGNHIIAKVPAEEIELIEHFSAAHPRG